MELPGEFSRQMLMLEFVSSSCFLVMFAKSIGQNFRTVSLVLLRRSMNLKFRIIAQCTNLAIRIQKNPVFVISSLISFIPFKNVAVA